MNKNLVRVGWITFALFCLILFTVIKLPQAPIQKLIDAHIANALAPYGASLSAKESNLSYIFGPTYKMKDVTLSLPPPANHAHIDHLSVSPSFLALIMGKVGGHFKIEEGEGTLKGSFSSGKTNFSVSLNADQLDIGKLGILPLLASLQVKAIVDGSVSISGEQQNLSSLEGDVKLHLTKLVFDSQSIAGFSIPKLSIGEGNIDLGINKGKVKFNTFKLGKAGGTDDIVATVVGEATLARLIEASTLNIKTRFSLSANIMKSFMLLDAILGVGKQPDGSYAFSLNGPPGSPVPSPITDASQIPQ